jgi:hypothetical protein
VEIEGVVKEFVWRNPHSFVRIEAMKDGKPETWNLEWGSSTQLSAAKYPVTRTTLKFGDRIIAGRASRTRSARRTAYGSSRSSGRSTAGNGRESSSETRAPGGGAYARWWSHSASRPVRRTGAWRRCAQQSGRAAAITDLTGYWVSVVAEHWHLRMLVPPKGDTTMLPVNAEARRVANAWDPAKDEAAGEACRSYGAPTIMRTPGRLHITWQDDNTLKIDADAGTQTRLCTLAAATAPAAGAWLAGLFGRELAASRAHGFGHKTRATFAS